VRDRAVLVQLKNPHHHQRNDPFRAHRLALSIIEADRTGTKGARVQHEFAPSATSSFAKFLCKHGLASLWHDFVSKQMATQVVGPEFLAALKQERFLETLFYLRQRSALQELDYLFESRGIGYAVIKGAHVRELVYGDPALRPANDLDILVSPSQRGAAAETLMSAGFEVRSNRRNISHEQTFVRDCLAVDLHWDILRPGRTRIDMAHPMLSRRKRIDDFWGLDDVDVVFLMLVHPALTKYICSTNVGLIRVVDFIFWLRKRPIDWDSVAERLDLTGLKTAAWAELQWFTMILKCARVPESFIDAISPGRWRAQYLTYWLQNNLPDRWLRRPLLIQLGLTLPLHDRVSDCQRAIAARIRAKQDEVRSIWGQGSML
jgi:hypothetical protein